MGERWGRGGGDREGERGGGEGGGHEYSEGLLICMQGFQVSRNWVSSTAVSLIFGTVPDTE